MLLKKNTLYHNISTYVISFLVIFAFYSFSLADKEQDESLKLHYTFNHTIGETTIVDESGNGYNALMKNGARIEKIGATEILDLGKSNGYVDLGVNTGKLIESLSDFTISTLLYIENTTSLSGNGNFIWNFGNSNNLATDANGCFFLSAKTTRYSISKTHWQAEQSVNYDKPFTKGEWKHIAYTQQGNTGIIYINGEKVKTDNISILPSNLGNTAFNYIGKSAYANDDYLKGAKLTDFRIYDRALTKHELKKLAQSGNDLNTSIFQQQLSNAAQSIKTLINNTITTSISLPAKLANNVEVIWKSSAPNVISETGKINRPAVGEKPAKVTLLATLSKGRKTLEQQITTLVLPQYNDKKAIKYDAENLNLNVNLENLFSSIELPTQGVEGSAINWKSDNTKYRSQ